MDNNTPKIKNGVLQLPIVPPADRQVNSINELNNITPTDDMVVMVRNSPYIYVDGWVRVTQPSANNYNSRSPQPYTSGASYAKIGNMYPKYGNLDETTTQPIIVPEEEITDKDGTTHKKFGKFTFYPINLVELTIVLFSGVGLIISICYSKTEIAATIAGGIIGYLSKSVIPTTDNQRNRY